MPAWSVGDRQSPQNGARNAKQEASDDRQGAPGSALQAGSPDSQADPGKHPSNVDDKPSADWSLVYLTVFVAIGTLIQAGMAVWQAFLLRAAGRDSFQAALQNKRLAENRIAIEEAKLREASASDASIFVVANAYAAPEANWAEVKFENIGATAAIILETSLEIVSASELPPIPSYAEPIARRSFGDHVVRRNGGLSVRRDGVSLTNEQWQAIDAESSRLWLYGYVDFLDFEKSRWREGFAISILQPADGEPGHPIRRGPDAYNFCRRINRAAQQADRSQSAQDEGAC